MADKKEKPLDPMSLATWARLRSAGKIAKPYGAEAGGSGSSPPPPKKPKKKKK